MKKMKLVVITVAILSIVWVSCFGYALIQVQTQRYLRPGDRYIRANQVQPTEDPKIWIFVKTNKTIEAEYQGELTEPLNPYVKKAIEIADRPIVVVIDSEENWNSLPISTGVYKFKDFYYLIGRGIATMYTEFPPDLETIDLSKFGITGIPLGIAWISIATYHFKQKRQAKK